MLIAWVPWLGPQVNDGRVRVNYYIQELFSDPQEVDDVWSTPLAIITMHVCLFHLPLASDINLIQPACVHHPSALGHSPQPCYFQDRPHHKARGFV